MAKLTRTETLLVLNSAVICSASFTQSPEGVSWNWERLSIIAMEIRSRVAVPMIAMVQTVRLTEFRLPHGVWNHEWRIANPESRRSRPTPTLVVGSFARRGGDLGLRAGAEASGAVGDALAL